ncbi:MAG: putative zinc ribbon domain protein [Firmicutes bacterium ADurb.Bin373]|nr:hypothetical protein [Bacillota bacterium]OQA10940.1 MAG: putative zinc ribbon domain protein [Firmicutes bacterium ADurb.Bin373]
MPDLKLLWEIQALDGRKRALEKKLKGGKMAEELKSIKADIEEGRALFNKIKEEYNGVKKSQKLKEMDVSSANEQLASLGKKLYDGSITNVKEMNSNSKKLESLKNMVKKAEDEILALMEKQDELRAKLEGMSAGLNNKAEKYRRKHSGLLAGQQKIRQSIAQIPLARQKLLDKLDVETWQRYMDMKKRFNDPLARVEKATCMGCRMGITFNELRLLKIGEDIVYCSNCGRMLYWEKQG